MAARTNDHRIRVLAVYTMLLNTDKFISTPIIRERLEKEYNIKAKRSTIYYDFEAISIFADLEHTHGKGYRIKKTAVKPGDVVYIVCNVDNKTVIEETAVEEVSTKRIWTDEVDYDLEEIGKSLFLNREEAEKALAEMEG